VGPGSTLLGGLPAYCVSDSLVENGNGATNTSGDEVSPLGDNQKFSIPTLASLDFNTLNYDEASDIKILFNIDEPQKDGEDTVQLIDLTLKVYDGTTLIASVDTPRLTDPLGEQCSSLIPTCTGWNDIYANFDSGNGNAGYLFGLSALEQTFFNQHVFVGGIANFGGYRLALETTIGLVDKGGGGPESFSFVAQEQLGTTITHQEVPEPGTLGLFGVGLAGLWSMRRKRRA
jgi:hypothetical protein